jgi:hypothetical protein
MPPWILAAIAAAVPIVVGAIALIRNLRSFIVPLWAAQLREVDVRRIAKGLEGLAAVAVPIAAMTPGELDNAAAALVDEYAKEFADLVKKYPVTATNIAKKVIDDRVSKSLASMSGAPVGLPAYKGTLGATVSLGTGSPEGVSGGDK